MIESVCARVSASLCISVSESVCVHVSASLCVSESVCVPRVGAADSCPLKSAPPWRKRGMRRVQYGAERPASPSSSTKGQHWPRQVWLWTEG